MVLAAFGLYHSQIETEEREDSLLTFHVAYLKKYNQSEKLWKNITYKKQKDNEQTQQKDLLYLNIKSKCIC